MFDHREGRHGRHGGEGAYARSRANNFGPRGGWEQWGERLEQRFAEVFGEKGGHGGGGGRRRMFDGSELRLVLLKMIADAPRHGYELIKAIEEMTGGAYAPSPGVVYPALTMLNEMELIEEQASEGARKRFAVTPAGEAHLAEHAEAVTALIARLTGLGAERSRGDHAPVRRAMHNLRHAVQNRVMRGDLDEDALYRIVALIDEAAQKVERLK
ncbi:MULTISPECIES: PadR family transcriptional regulator [unclassified Sphingomonas]|nr:MULTISPECIES: PadR family transcriptional regulator [unclassified Sphingomonas]AXJ97074.1 PadR family transcriptional regulator [Sphingomonas sp. FARSPH]